MEKKVEKSALKSHRERVDEMNKFLDSLSDVRFFCWILLMGSIMICLKSALANPVGIFLCFMWQQKEHVN